MAQNFQNALKAWWNGEDFVSSKDLALSKKTKTKVVDRQHNIEACRMLYYEALTEILGDGFIEIGGAELNKKLFGLFILNSNKTILNLSCGLGGPIRELALEYKIWGDAYEENPILRGLAFKKTATSKAFNRLKIYPINYNGDCGFAQEKYHYAFSRERMFTIKKKNNLIKQVAQSLRSQGEFIITDYVLAEDVSHEDNEVKDFIEKEMTKVYLYKEQNYREAIKESGFELRNIKDYSAEYAEYIIKSWLRLHKKLEDNKIDAKLYPYLIYESEIWLRRFSILASSKLKYLHILCQKKIDKDEDKKSA